MAKSTDDILEVVYAELLEYDETILDVDPVARRIGPNVSRALAALHKRLCAMVYAHDIVAFEIHPFRFATKEDVDHGRYALGLTLTLPAEPRTFKANFGVQVTHEEAPAAT